MTHEKALAEARKRWGPDAAAWRGELQPDGLYRIATVRLEGGSIVWKVLGSGHSWRSALKNARDRDAKRSRRRRYVARNPERERQRIARRRERANGEV